MGEEVNAAALRTRGARALPPAPALRADPRPPRAPRPLRRLSLTLSDGTHYLNALCSPRLNAEVKGVQKDGTIRIVAGVCNLVSGRRCAQPPAPRSLHEGAAPTASRARHPSAHRRSSAPHRHAALPSPLLIRPFLCPSSQTPSPPSCSVLILNQLEVLSAAPLPAGRLGSPVDVERAAHGLAEMKTPSPHGGGSGALASLAAERKLACGRVVPIASLTPYMASFAIKGRLTLLEEPRGYSRGDKAGRVMTIQICDAVRAARGAPRATVAQSTCPLLPATHQPFPIRAQPRPRPPA